MTTRDDSWLRSRRSLSPQQPCSSRRSRAGRCESRNALRKVGQRAFARRGAAASRRCQRHTPPASEEAANIKEQAHRSLWSTRLPRPLPPPPAARRSSFVARASQAADLKQLATASAKALPARCAPRPMRSPARGAATASTSGSRRPLASVSSPLPVMPTQHNWKSIQGLVRNDGVELLSGRCELCAEAAVARGSVSRSFSPSGMPVAKCRTGCDVCKVHICQKCYRAGLFESYAHPGDCSGLGSSSVMMD